MWDSLSEETQKLVGRIEKKFGLFEDLKAQSFLVGKIHTGAFRMVDGTEVAEYVLTCDGDGVGSWRSHVGLGGDVYDTVWVPAISMAPLDTNGAAFSSDEYATNDIMTDFFLFDGTTEEYVAWNMPLPPNWDQDVIRCIFYWAPDDSTCTAGDTVEWEVACLGLSNDDAIDTAPGTGQVISDVVLAGKDADLHITTTTPDITIGGSLSANDMVHFKISRNVGGTDDMTEDARLFGVFVQFITAGALPIFT